MAKKFGMLAPSTNTIVQPDFHRMEVPGVTSHTATRAVSSGIVAIASSTRSIGKFSLNLDLIFLMLPNIFYYFSLLTNISPTASAVQHSLETKCDRILYTCLNH